MFGSGGVELAYEMGIAEGPQSTSWGARAQIIAGLTRGPRGGRGSGLLPAAPWSPASRPLGPRGWPWSPGGTPPDSACPRHRASLSAELGAGFLGRCPPRAGEGGEGGPFKARLLGHVVLNTCSFYLLISPRCSKSRGRKGVSQSPEELVQKIKVRVCPNDPLKGLSKLAAKVTSLPCPLLLSPTPLPTSASETAVRGRGGLRHPSWTLRGEPER